MKKLLFPALFLSAISLVLITSCKKKEDNTIQPTYKNLALGTGANPCINCVTVGGTTTYTNPATANTSILVGGSGWGYDACATTANTLKGVSGSTIVNLLIGGATVTTATYALTENIPVSGQARLTITNAPNQPDGIVWYAKSGTVAVTTSTNGTTAIFNNVPCLQKTFLFPVVTASGSLTCI